MTIYDSVNKTEVEVDGTKGLIEKMKEGRQVDLYLKEKKSDEDGYMSWDVEHWSSVDGKRFIRCYGGKSVERVHRTQHLRSGE